MRSVAGSVAGVADGPGTAGPEAAGRWAPAASGSFPSADEPQAASAAAVRTTAAQARNGFLIAQPFLRA
ncbi:hypothetical protein [Streptomyces sp. st170]|uniref:hypothetical protein n=1 Tax=Streptomyces sp. st170 TaxID=1828058 RepID=UPI00117D67B8|nr:hypothetical protein [Streptomyces sp. st170]